MPRDVNERCMLTVDLVYKSNEMGVSNEDIWIDPIATPVSGEINQVKACLEFFQMLPEIAPGCKSIVGLVQRFQRHAGAPQAVSQPHIPGDAGALRPVFGHRRRPRP